MWVLTKKDCRSSLIINYWRWWECLARSRLTAVPCFADRFSILGKNTPASAHSRRTHLTGLRPVWVLTTLIKKRTPKRVLFFIWRWWESNPRPKWNKASVYEYSSLLSCLRPERNITDIANKVLFAEEQTFCG